MADKQKLERLTYTVREVAQILGVGRNTTYEAVKQGKIRSVRVGGKIIIPKAEIERILNGEPRG